MTWSSALFMEIPRLTTLWRVVTDLGLQGYVVGGCLRDLLLGREVNDVDIAVAGDAERCARQFALECRGTFFRLDQERGHCRVVIKGGGQPETFDFAPLRGKDIVADLALRDFTINALAVPLMGQAVLIDPLGGAADISAQLVRRCSRSSFRDDPLRLVRAFRFAATLRFRIETETLAAISGHLPPLANVAGERIRDEFFRILQESGAGSSFCEMGSVGLLGVVFGLESARIGQAAKAIDMVEKVVDSFSLAAGEQAEKIGLRMGVEVQSGVTVLALMKLAAFIDAAGIGPNVPADRLKLGKAARNIMEALCHARALPSAGYHTPSSAFRLFNDSEPAGLELPLQLLARGHITESHCRELAGYYLHSHIPRGGSLLLSSAEIMTLLSVPPGKAVGEAHELLREAQCTGEVNTEAEARAFLRKKLLTTSEPMG